jgi:uncharacterized protein with PQ loop repeat
MTELIGWTSSGILLVTLLVQVRKQWKARRTEAVSPWLFLGQLAANLGFVAYSVLVGNAVFVVTNSLLAVVAVTGFVVLQIHRRRERALRARPGGPATPSPEARARQSVEDRRHTSGYGVLS